MTSNLKSIAILIICTGMFSAGYAQKQIKHFIFFSTDRELIKSPDFYLNKGVEGAQITYPWKQLEPQKGKYDFSEIEEDLAFLTAKHKRLFIQIQDVTFDSTFSAIPPYLLNDSIYHGGQNSKYEIDKNGIFIKTGWVSRRWDPAVVARYHKLLEKLALKFDAQIEGINLPETAVDFPGNKETTPVGFTRKNYLQAIESNMLFLKTNFKHAVTLQYANFMPFDAEKDLKEIYRYAKEIHAGIGGPDIKVYKKAQMDNSYPLIKSISPFVKTGVAVQDGNADVINPKTNKKVTIGEIVDFAHNYLNLDYIFWGVEEPFYSKEVLPMLSKVKK